MSLIRFSRYLKGENEFMRLRGSVNFPADYINEPEAITL